MIVTGGGRGIGAATARLAAGRGYAVCVNYLANAEAADAVVRDIEAAGGRAIAVQANVAVEAEVERLFAAVDRELGPVTALVNNAGLAGPIDRLDAAPSETIRQVIEVNVFGVAAVTASFLPLLARPGGRIVNVSSGAGKIVTPLLDNYEAYNSPLCISQSTEKGGLLLVKLGEHPDLLRELRQYIKTDKLVRYKTDDSNPETLKRILRDRADENRERDARLRRSR